MLNKNQRFRFWFCLMFLAAVSLIWLPVCFSRQEVRRGAKEDMLPPTTGKAVSVSPTNGPDVECAVETWNIGDKPELTLLCPPGEVSAPIHIYLKFSWLKSEDVPPYAQGIRAPSKSPTKLRTNKKAVWIWLDVQDNNNTSPRKQWVPFTGVVDMALLNLSKASLKKSASERTEH